MFTIDTTIIDFKTKDKQLFKVLFSMNSHQVANPEMSLEEARSYVFFFRDGGKFQVYIGLYFIPTDRRLFYTHSSNPFPEGALAEIEGEARNFAEDLGAMLDEIDFVRLSTAEREHWISEQEFLSGRKKQEEVQVPEKPRQPEKEQQASLPDQPVQPIAAPPAKPAEVVLPVTTVTIAGGQPQPEPPAQRQTPVEPVTAVTRTVPAAPVQPVQSADAAEEAAPVRSQTKPQKRTAAQSPAKAEEAIVETKQPVAAKAAVDDVLDEAVRAGVMKAPKAQLKKEIRTASGGIGREKEALARLLASF
ncbi:MAG: hypothetical protein A2010_02890 [Nitrospirae bacterium GWD2_57_9]|nr:MAG: hypothetical protein A2010_02890 [Nitrospirae bacterium GWD2_57_9]